jgi:alkylated DNA repair dioxygenase AlkB
MSLYEKFITKKNGDSYYKTLELGIPWKIFTKAKKSRLVFNYNTDCKNDNVSKECQKILVNLILQLQKDKEVEVQDIFMNYYRDGADYCNYHKDYYGRGIETYALSLGTSRDFVVKDAINPFLGYKNKKKAEKTKYLLKSGDLFHMDDIFNRAHLHSVPKRSRIKTGRISIVFFVTQKE